MKRTLSRTIKYAFSILTVLLILFSLSALTSFADSGENFIFTPCEGGVILSGFDGKIGKTLKIPQKNGSGDDVVGIGEGAFANCDSIKEIVFPSGLAFISERAFSGCSSLENVIVPDSVLSIGEYAFSGCTSLGNVILPDGGTSLGKGVFSDCSMLSFISLGETSSIPDYAFYNCQMLNGITLPASLAEIGVSAFYKCSSLTEIAVPGGVKVISDSAFYKCSSLRFCIIAEGTQSIERNAFFGCTSIRDVILPPSISFIGANAFDGCSLLSDVYFHGDLPSAKPSSSNYRSFPLSSILNFSSSSNGYNVFGWNGYRSDCWDDKCTHSLKSWSLVSSVSCLEDGIRNAVCDKCGKILYSSVIPAHSHVYGENVCVLCGDTLEVSLPGAKNGFYREDGNVYFYENGEKVTGWFEAFGKTYYADKKTASVIMTSGIIGSKQYFYDGNKGLVLADGFYQNIGTNRYATLDTSNGKATTVTVATNGTICFDDGYLVYGWRHSDGSSVKVEDGIYEQYSTSPDHLYYFLSSTYIMVTEESYVLGGWTREFGYDHTVKPLDGVQMRYGEMYLYKSGVMQTGWQNVNGMNYYFYRETGKAATMWTVIGGKLYYFYAGTSATPYALKTSGTIGGINYDYAKDGSISTTGFFNAGYANENKNNTAPYIQKKNETAMYYENGVRAEGWKEISGKWYYFYKGTGLMVTESRTIGGVWYEFSSDGVCLDR